MSFPWNVVGAAISPLLGGISVLGNIDQDMTDQGHGVHWHLFREQLAIRRAALQYQAVRRGPRDFWGDFMDYEASQSARPDPIAQLENDLAQEGLRYSAWLSSADGQTYEEFHGNG